MLTNGFAVFRGSSAAAAARDALKRVERYSRHVMVDVGGGFEELKDARLDERRAIVLAYSLEKTGSLPLVHGFIREWWDGSVSKNLPRGEFSVLLGGRDGFLGARDPLGTRGLWIVREGNLAGSMATDHRLLDPSATLVKAGHISEGRDMWSVTPKKDGIRRPGSFDEAAEELAALVRNAVEERVKGERRVAVSFSGGLDSSLLALVASKYSEVILCSAFVEGSLDEAQTAKGAERMGLQLETASLDERSIKMKLADIGMPPGETTTMDRALWSIYSTTSELASNSKARMVLLGQLADELFGGYKKYSLKARSEGDEAAEAMMAEDVAACGERGFLRDEAACSRWTQVRFPYADWGIASFATALPFRYKIRGDERKAVLRAAALKLGLPEELAKAPKKAAQFSSGASKLLKRVTGF